MADSDSTQKDTYFVAVKIFLEKDGKFFIFKDRFGAWDLPGGRIKKDEFRAPLDSIIRRKMREEIGATVEYEVGEPIVFMRHERIDAASAELSRIFAISYHTILTKGEPDMSAQHVEGMWVDPKTFEPEKYFTGGWLEGVYECDTI